MSALEVDIDQRAAPSKASRRSVWACDSYNFVAGLVETWIVPCWNFFGRSLSERWTYDSN